MVLKPGFTVILVHDAVSRIAGGNQYDVLNGGENLFNTILGASYDTTMLQLKVELLQCITGMAYADGSWNWGHRDNFLQHTYAAKMKQIKST